MFDMKSEQLRFFLKTFYPIPQNIFIKNSQKTMLHLEYKITRWSKHRSKYLGNYILKNNVNARFSFVSITTTEISASSPGLSTKLKPNAYYN